jgi:hypothetical protein
MWIQLLQSRQPIGSPIRKIWDSFVSVLAIFQSTLQTPPFQFPLADLFAARWLHSAIPATSLTLKTMAWNEAFGLPTHRHKFVEDPCEPKAFPLDIVRHQVLGLHSSCSRRWRRCWVLGKHALATTSATTATTPTILSIGAAASAAAAAAVFAAAAAAAAAAAVRVVPSACIGGIADLAVVITKQCSLLVGHINE